MPAQSQKRRKNEKAEWRAGVAVFPGSINRLIKIYYGAADTYICYEEMFLSDVLQNLLT
jgi:hypothetical protein